MNIEYPDDGELEAWRSVADDLLRERNPSQPTLRRAAHLLQNAYIFSNALRAATPAWQPIETAPHGVNVLCYTGDGFRYPMVCECCFDDGEWWPNTWESTETALNPTHWMPLPPTPEPVK